jgi:hypothetical protein
MLSPRNPVSDRFRPEPVGPAPVRTPFGGKLPTFKKGGKVKKTGPAIVHKGEKIIPAKKKK